MRTEILQSLARKIDSLFIPYAALCVVAWRAWKACLVATTTAGVRPEQKEAVAGGAPRGELTAVLLYENYGDGLRLPAGVGCLLVNACTRSQ